MKKIAYNKTVLQLISELSVINPQVIIKRNDDTGRIDISCANTTRTTIYRLSAPLKAFEFEDDCIAFYNFQDFYKFLDAAGVASLYQDERDPSLLVIDGETGKLRYNISNPDVIKDGPKKVPFENPAAGFTLQAATLVNLTKMVNLVKSENTMLTFDGETVNMKLYNNVHKNSYDTDLSLTNTVDEAFTMTILNEIYKLLPSGYDYSVEVIREGLIRFTLISEADISVEIFTAETEEN